MKKSIFQMSSLLAIFFLGSLLFFACNKEEPVLQEENIQIDVKTNDEQNNADEVLRFIYKETDVAEKEPVSRSGEYCLYKVTGIEANDCYEEGDILCLPCKTDLLGFCPIAIDSPAIITKITSDGIVTEIELTVTSNGVGCTDCPDNGKRLNWG